MTQVPVWGTILIAMISSWFSFVAATSLQRLREDHERRMEVFRLEMEEVKTMRARVMAVWEGLYGLKLKYRSYQLAKENGDTNGVTDNQKRINRQIVEMFKAIDDLNQAQLTTPKAFRNHWNAMIDTADKAVRAVFQALQEVDANAGAGSVEAAVRDFNRDAREVLDLLRGAVVNFRNGKSTFEIAKDDSYY